MTTIGFHASLRVSRIGFWPVNVSRSGGVASNGQEQIVGSGVGHWAAEAVLMVRTEEHVRLARWMFASLQGRANSVWLPAFEWGRLPWPVDAYGRTLSPSFTRNPKLDGTIYEDPAVPTESAVNATVQTTAALRATQIAINFTQGGPLLHGHFFGIGERLHVVTDVVSQVGSVQTVTFWPPLRAQATATTAVRVTDPVCKMRLTSDDQSLKGLGPIPVADVPLQWREVL